jgi:hypothetical protein
MTAPVAVALLLLASAELICVPRAGRLVCSDGGEHALVDARPRADGPDVPVRPFGPWRPDATTTPGALGGGRVPGPDGLLCWPHGDHFHCRR